VQEHIHRRDAEAQRTNNYGDTLRLCASAVGLSPAPAQHLPAPRTTNDHFGPPTGDDNDLSLSDTHRRIVILNGHGPFGPPTVKENDLTHSETSSRIVILSVAKNQLVGVRVRATDSATPSSVLRRMILRSAQNDRSRLSPGSGRWMTTPDSSLTAILFSEERSEESSSSGCAR